MTGQLIDKQEIIEAINSYSEFTPSQKKILSLLVSVSVDGDCKITKAIIAEKTGVVRATIRSALSLFSENGYITIQYKGNRVIGCNISSEKIQKIVLQTKGLRNI